MEERALPSKTEVRAAYEAALTFAIKVTRSRERGQELVQAAFERMLTTRAWDPGKVPFDVHMIGIVRSLLYIEHHSAQPRNEQHAGEGFHQEVVGRSTASAEDRALEHAEAEMRREMAARQLEQLAERVADHPVAPGVLRCRTEGVTRAADIATHLGVPVEQVYRANELLKEQLKKIREGG
jgi:DNA-directed RNA polymerase specialized sigma24 family protein